MSIIVFTYWESSDVSGRKVEYIDHGYDERTGKIVILPPDPVATCDYVKWDSSC